MTLEEWLYSKKHGGLINWLMQGDTQEYLYRNYKATATEISENVERCKNLRFIGLEFELENVGVLAVRTVIAKVEQEKALYNFHKFWRTTSDGSLRNNGIEIISLRGLSTQNLVEALEALELAFKHYFKPGIEISSRCSLHLHYNVWDYTLEELRSLILVYTMVESALYAVSGNRRDNIFCIPNSKMHRNYWSYLFSSASKKRSKKAEWDILSSHYQKYSGLNLRPIHEYGTIEFRQHAGTTDLTEVKSWIQIINEICETSRIHTWKEWVEIAKEAWDKNQEKDLIEFISPSLFTKLSNRNIDFKVLCEKDIKHALWTATDEALMPELSDMDEKDKQKYSPSTDWESLDLADWSNPITASPE